MHFAVKSHHKTLHEREKEKSEKEKLTRKAFYLLFVFVFKSVVCYIVVFVCLIEMSRFSRTFGDTIPCHVTSPFPFLLLFTI